MGENNSKTGFYPADILLPKRADWTKWAVVACDQFTSQPEYWQAVRENVGSEPSTLNLILPEVELNAPDVVEKIRKINRTMDQYLEQGELAVFPNALIYVERVQSDGKIRHGLIGVIDLEQYDFAPGNQALVRATEGTVLTRIPPRVKVREHAAIELPHVMLLIDDPEKTVIEPLTASVQSMQKLYDFDLQGGGGHICGYLLSQEQQEQTSAAMQALASEEQMEKKYGLSGEKPLLFAVGDGNHSLATAKQCYENLKAVTPEKQWKNLPARYALVEVVNNHDDALQFEPIHRVVFDTDPEKLLAAFHQYYPNAYEGKGEGHRIAYCYAGKKGMLTIPDPTMQLAVGSLQVFLDAYGTETGAEVDYIHGDDTAEELGSRPGNIAFLLPAMQKQELFKTVMADGILPRKTFSMGHAQDKRYYIEARKIR